MPIPRQPFLLPDDLANQLRHVLHAPDFANGFVGHVDGAAVQGTIRGGDGAGGRGERVSERGGGEEEGGGGGGERVVGIEDPEFGEGGDVLGARALGGRVDVVHHGEDVGDEGRSGRGGGGGRGGVSEGDGIGVAVGHCYDGAEG